MEVNMLKNSMSIKHTTNHFIFVKSSQKIGKSMHTHVVYLEAQTKVNSIENRITRSFTLEQEGHSCPQRFRVFIGPKSTHSSQFVGFAA